MILCQVYFAIFFHEKARSLASWFEHQTTKLKDWFSKILFETGIIGEKKYVLNIGIYV